MKNTGRLGELLLPGASVLVEPADNPNRKTRYSLICVKAGDQWVNIDSQAPNKLAEEDGSVKEDFFRKFLLIKREKKYGNSRFDLYVETAGEKWMIEVKGVTLCVDGKAMFPDAPTERGKKHVEELIHCQKDGYRAAILFVIQRKGVSGFTPFEKRQPEFAAALRSARDSGVKVLAVDCRTDEREITIDRFIPVYL